MSCRAEISIVNLTPATVAVGSTLPLGAVTRRFGNTKGCNGCCTPVLNLSGTSAIVINESGYYDFNVNVTFTAATAGNATITMLLNGVPVPGFTATTNIATATTQAATLTICAPDIRVFCNGVPATVTFVVSGIAITTSNIAVSAHKL